MKNLLVFYILIIFTAGRLFGQVASKSKNTGDRHPGKNNEMNIPEIQSHLFQYGIASAFIEGLYEGELSIRELQQHGNFGIGAPDLIDGELTMVDGKVYQSNAKGQTFEAPATLKTPFAFVTAFKPDAVFPLSNIQSINDLFAAIEPLLSNPNGIYAIRITGRFSRIRTRAFPPVKQKPFKPLAQMLDQQHFFENSETEGEMIGFYMPGYLSGLNIAGLHFHFLSDDRKAGGHVVGLNAENLRLEMAEIKGFYLQPLQTDDFEKIKFINGNSPGLQKIEKGSN